MYNKYMELCKAILPDAKGCEGSQEVSSKNATLVSYGFARYFIMGSTLRYRLIANTAGVMANHEALVVS